MESVWRLCRCLAANRSHHPDEPDGVGLVPKRCAEPPKAKAMMAKKRTPKTEAPKTTAQQLGTLVKSARDIMRKDKGLNGDLDRLPMLTWIMFLKFLDDLEQIEETGPSLGGKKYRPAIEPPYRWRDWAAKEGRHHRRRTHQVHQP